MNSICEQRSTPKHLVYPWWPIQCRRLLSPFFSLIRTSPLRAILSNFKLGLISLSSSVCAQCVAARLKALQRRLLMWGIYLSNWSPTGWRRTMVAAVGGAEGTAVRQRSVPHYCFLMRRSEGLLQISPSGLAPYGSGCRSSYLRWYCWVSVSGPCRKTAHCFANPLWEN